ncbi:sialate O-acetylesterase [uncultured Paludibaculum sp.]|uniref:sialate O-acetylesterase n=1 Tax=uncultured Paludibaculum sp. TaxID=1765020 RepID=UPI002AAACE10|nr:sialate O-acetylesterase [uncultured Paludibaculum sp.]
MTAIPLRRVACLLPALAALLCAEVHLPALFTDHMVVQRNRPVHIWGTATPGETIAATFRGNTATTQATSLGQFSLRLPPGPEGGPLDLTIKATNTITLHDVLVGDVWIASGQSNMEFATRDAIDAAKEMAAANYPNIRLFRVENNVATHPLDDVTAAPWSPVTTQSVASFSAVAYFFGRHLNDKLHIPIGLIESNWGGTPAEAWTSLRALSSDASLMPVFSEWAKMNDDAITTRLRREQQLAEWQKSVDQAKADGRKAPGRPWAPNERDCWSPAGLYNAMIAPLTPFPIRGAIWYQGESNAGVERVSTYARLFQTMIQDWRRAWSEDFPFLFVQLANYTTGPGSRWPELREAQRQTLALRNTAMATAIDIGDPGDIHPKNKQSVGERLGLAARAVAYGENIEHAGPAFRQAVPEGASLRIYFDHTGTGLITRPNGLRGFEIAGADHKYVAAEARLDGLTVVLSSPSITQPVSARYAWKDNPETSLYNKEGLPATPFQTLP